MDRLIQFETVRPLPHFPQLTHLGFETRADPSYHWEGRGRPGGAQCIFQYSLAGCGVFRDAAGEHPLPPGSGFLCESHDPATAYYYPATGRGAWSFWFLSFAGPVAHELVRDLVGRHGAIYGPPSGKGVVKWLCGFRGQASTVWPMSPAAGGALILELLAALEGSCQERLAESPEERLARRAKREIEETLDGRLNVATLAARLCVTREHLSRVFKARTGMTPYQYILRRQMMLACQWLAAERLSVKEVAGRLGFASPGNFIRVFHTLVGETPARFRAAGTLPHLL